MQAQVPGAGLATVYRAIKELVEEGWLQAVNVPGEPPRYERANLPQHHHFLCRACGRLFDLEPLKAPRFASLAPKGSVVEEEELVLKGTCAECATVAKGEDA
jgi:Fur family ferric uptake transcriptional regulator